MRFGSGKAVICFDNAATTDAVGNPSSPHWLGINAERQLNAATSKIATLIGCRPDEIIYTSGGTESNNLSIIGAAASLAHKGGVILTTPGEHPSVTEPLRYISDGGKFSIIEAPVNRWLDYLNDDVVFASCTHVNHETGDINNLGQVVSIIKGYNSKIILHIDGAQGFCKEPASLSGIDLYSFSAHKFHGPPGVGGLFVKRGTVLKPSLYGGGQQRGLRPGSINMPGVLAMSDAIEASYRDMTERRQHVLNIKNVMQDITNELPDVFLNAEGPQVSPYILNISFMGIKGETLVHMLSEQGIYVSMGAACSSSKKNRAFPLMRMGYSKERAESAVRFSFSYLNTTEEAKTVKQVLVKSVTTLREVIRYGK
jgi:cysteine desulfurase